MKKLLGGMLAIVLVMTAATAQDRTQIFTRPALPPREALDRLNLQLGWRAQLPTDGMRDGIVTFQMAGRQLLVQNRSGLVTALDRDTGQTLWRNRVGKPYDTAHSLAWNNKSVFVTHGTWLFALDRHTGQLQWQYNLPDAVTCGPAADDLQIYLCMGANQCSIYELPPESRRELTAGGMVANKNYVLPAPDAFVRPPAFHSGSSGTAPGVGPLSGAIQATRIEGIGPRPRFIQEFRLRAGAELPPLITHVVMAWAGADGTVLVVPKEIESSRRPYRYPTNGTISVQPAQYGELAYVASHDGNLYALDLPTGQTLWRYPGGNPITQKPLVTNDDVYITPQGSGLLRLDRVTGQVKWRNPAAQRFMAANDKFVYAADRSNRLMVLDRARGTELSTYDGTREFVVSLTNEQTDRLYLAAHDGQLICLHDRAYGKPLVMKEDEEKLLPPPGKADIGLPPPKPDIKMPGKPDDKMPGKPDDKMPEKP